MAGLTSGKTALWAAGSIKLANMVHRSLSLPITRQLTTQPRGKAPEARHAPPCLTARNSQQREGLFASTGLSNPATEAEWSKLIQDLEAMPIFSPADLGGVQPEHLRLIPERPRFSALIGKLWRSAIAITHGAAGQTNSTAHWRVADTWGALELAGTVSGDPANKSSLRRGTATPATKCRPGRSRARQHGPLREVLGAFGECGIGPRHTSFCRLVIES